MSPAVRKLLAIALPACGLAVLLSLALIEAWVRLRWDDRLGTPGFYLSDPVLGQRLTPGYRGWFAGVPVRINTLGFRDPRDYSIEKRPGTFRILVLGDSVTFGHGSLDETTYPFLLEARLKAWRPDVGWEVWNLGVPGYNTSQELAYLKEVGPTYDPDLVIIGFFPNDFSDNVPPFEPTALQRAGSAVQRRMQQYLYSFEFYKRVLLTLRWRLWAGQAGRQRIEQLAGEELLLRVDDVSGRADQRLSQVDYFDDQQVRDFICYTADAQTDPSGAEELRARIRQRAEDIAPWLDAVRALQQLGRDGVYRLMFFINMAPKTCPGEDRFFDLGSLPDDDLLLEVLGDGVAVASSTRAFMHYRPSQMPFASGHSFGNANKVKADVLFEFLRTYQPPLLPLAVSTP